MRRRKYAFIALLQHFAREPVTCFCHFGCFRLFYKLYGLLACHVLYVDAHAAEVTHARSDFFFYGIRKVGAVFIGEHARRIRRFLVTLENVCPAKSDGTPEIRSHLFGDYGVFVYDAE